MHLSVHLHTNIQSSTWNFSKLQKWSGMRQSNLAETEDLVGRRNCREFGHKFYFLFLVRRIWWSSQPGYKWERAIEDRARKRQGTLTSLVRCREYWRHMSMTQCEPTVAAPLGSNFLQWIAWPSNFYHFTAWPGNFLCQLPNFPAKIYCFSFHFVIILLKRAIFVKNNRGKKCNDFSFPPSFVTCDVAFNNKILVRFGYRVYIWQWNFF
jgi:hypothetical protein